MIVWAKTRRGFTIVELLIVVVVIAILAAITLVTYTGIRENARLSAALQFEAQLKHRYGAYATGDWGFDECSGTSAQNSANGGSNAAVGAVSWITDTPSGSGCAIRFAGSTRFETQAELKANGYVKSAWVRINSGSCASSNNVLSQGAGGANAAFYAQNCTPRGGHNGAWGTVIAPGTPLDDYRWHHIALVWENGTLRLYVDAALVASAAAVAPSPLGTVAIAAHSGGNYLVGDIDSPFIASW